MLSMKFRKMNFIKSKCCPAGSFVSVSPAHTHYSESRHFISPQFWPPRDDWMSITSGRNTENSLQSYLSKREVREMQSLNSLWHFGKASTKIRRTSVKLLILNRMEPSNLEKSEWVKGAEDQMCKSQDCTYSLLVVNALFLLIHYANTYATFYEAKVKTNQTLL